VRFLGDIPIGRLTLQHLVTRGHDAVGVSEYLAPTASDPDIIRLAAKERRVILCFDLDLATLVALSRESLPSVITFRTTRRSAGYVNQRLDALLPDLEVVLARGALVTVEDARIRIRRLPVSH